MTKTIKTAPVTLSLTDRIAAIEAARATFEARCDRLVAESLRRDERVTALMGW